MASKQQGIATPKSSMFLTIPGKVLVVWRCRSLLTLAPVAGSAGLRLDLSMCRNVASVLFSNQVLSPIPVRKQPVKGEGIAASPTPPLMFVSLSAAFVRRRIALDLVMPVGGR